MFETQNPGTISAKLKLAEVKALGKLKRLRVPEYSGKFHEMVINESRTLSDKEWNKIVSRVITKSKGKKNGRQDS